MLIDLERFYLFRQSCISSFTHGSDKALQL